MKVVIGSDHAGFELKDKIIQYLKVKHIEVLDKGCYSADRADYPDFGHAVAVEVLKSNVFGIVICGSGNGINMSVNKHKGVRGALCWNAEIASLARQHNDANIMALPARFISEEEAKNVWMRFYLKNLKAGDTQTGFVKLMFKWC
jgi:ribose 5-phosphate isomerase B